MTKRDLTRWKTQCGLPPELTAACAERAGRLIPMHQEAALRELTAFCHAGLLGGAPVGRLQREVAAWTKGGMH